MERSGAEIAVVVLGAKVREDGTPGPALARRARHGAAVWRAHPGAWLVLTGGIVAHPPAEAEAAASLLRAEGVPEDALLLETRSTDTLGNLVEAARLLGTVPPGGLILVTDRWHLPRARLAARLLGLRAVGAPVRPGPDFASAPRVALAVALETLSLVPTLVRAAAVRVARGSFGRRG